MQPRQPAQLLVAKGLDTETEAIDAGRRIAREIVGRNGLRIGLERDLASGGNVERRRQASMIAATSSGASSDGVPPPK